MMQACIKAWKLGRLLRGTGSCSAEARGREQRKKIDPMGPIGSAAVERVEDGTLFFREHLASSVQFVDLPRLSRPKLS